MHHGNESNGRAYGASHMFLTSGIMSRARPKESFPQCEVENVGKHTMSNLTWGAPRCAKCKAVYESKAYWNAKGRYVGERSWCRCEDKSDRLYGTAWGGAVTYWDAQIRNLVPISSAQPVIPSAHPLHPSNLPEPERGDAWEGD